MSKAGIITLFGEYNFGNRLQNYAVQEVLKRKGLEVETIKYMKKANEIPVINNEKDERRLKKFKKFNEQIKFADKILYMDEEIPERLAEDYDYIVLGSDQIWNYSFSSFACDKIMGGFIPKGKKFSFSASFGVDFLPQYGSKLYKDCQRNLKELKAISVREDAGKKIVEELTGREDVEVLIDPTMMLEKEQWESVMKKPENLKTNQFIVKSFLGNVSKQVEEELNRFAKEHNCEIIDISNKDSEFYDMGPAEFLYLEKNALLVATDSFHACVFSILFSTPFVIFEREDIVASMYSRIETLVKKFGLRDSVFKGRIEENVLQNQYESTYQILEREREKANKFLERALR